MKIKKLGLQLWSIRNSMKNAEEIRNSFRCILEAADRAGVEYYIVEQDDCEGDPFEAVRQSAEYLRENFM